MFEREDPALFHVATKADGPMGALPLNDTMLRELPSGDLFGLSQNAGMGWPAAQATQDPFLILSTLGGIRAPDGSPIALGYHTGHWEVGLLVEEAARALRAQGKLPFAGFCSDPCDGRSQGTLGMMDSLAYRNDAAIVLRRLIRSLPTRKGVLGVATCDKVLPAMMMALAGQRDLPGIIVPGGVTLPPKVGEDAGKIQTIGVRYVHGQLSLAEAAELGCRACATPGGGCQFLGTAATAQVVAEALGIALPHSALAPSGQPIWKDIAIRSARALVQLSDRAVTMDDVLTDRAIRNAMTVFSAFGGSTNLLLHIPAIAHAAKRTRPVLDDWIDINRRTPRLVDALPNGPVGFATVQVYLAGAVPEVMLHLAELGLLDLDVMTVAGVPLGTSLDAWRTSERRQALRNRLATLDGVDPDDVILPPKRAAAKGLTSTLCFPRGNLAPQGSVVKSTSIDPTVIDADGVYRITGPAKVFFSEVDAITAIKRSAHPEQYAEHEIISAGEVLVLAGRGPLGCGMEETYQVTSALKHLPFGKHVALVTDARFSGVSTGACLGHVGPEALAGGPIGLVQPGDLVEIIVDRRQLVGTVNLVGRVLSKDHATPSGRQEVLGQEWGTAELARRAAQRENFNASHPPARSSSSNVEYNADEHGNRLQADPRMHDDVKLWALLQSISGGTWGGCVYDYDAIAEHFRKGVNA